MSAPLAVGVIGAGPWARMVTGPLLAAGPQTRVTGVWSRTHEHAQSLAASLEVPSFADLDALFDACDAVAIAVAPAAQPALALAAAARGKAMLLEKPLAADVAGAEAIVAAAPRAVVMLSNRFNPALDKFLDEARSIDALGGRGCFVSGAFLGGPFAQGWRMERGAVLDVGPHLLDLLDASLGDIVDVDAQGDPLGWVSLVCLHASGVTSSASLCCSAASEGRIEVDVFGRRASITYDGGVVDYDAWADRVRDGLFGVASGRDPVVGVERALHLQRLIAKIEAQL
jgi:predicted dehydrogenase